MKKRAKLAPNFTTADLGWLGNAEKSIIGWLYHRMVGRLMSRYGGVQWCPWCNQCTQAHDGWHFDSKTDPYIDALHCGNCGGESRWRFELGMMPLDPIGLQAPPVPTPETAQLTEEVVVEAARAGWRACRKQVYALSEDTLDDDALDAAVLAGGFAASHAQGRRHEAKGISRALHSLGPENCDELSAAIDLLQKKHRS